MYNSFTHLYDNNTNTKVECHTLPSVYNVNKITVNDTETKMGNNFISNIYLTYQEFSPFKHFLGLLGQLISTVECYFMFGFFLMSDCV